MNIHELNSSLKGSNVLNEDEGNFIILERHSKPEDFTSLTQEQSESIRRILKRINQSLENDVGFNLTLDGIEPQFDLVYADGCNMESAEGVPFSDSEQLYEYLENLDLDELRSRRLQLMSDFDELIQSQKNQPQAVRSVKAARKICKSGLKEFHKDMRKAKLPIALFLLDEDYEGYGLRTVLDTETDEQMRERLAEVIPLGISLVSVCYYGKAVALKDVEKLQKEALEILA